MNNRYLNYAKENDLAHGEFMSWYQSIGLDKHFVSKSMTIAKQLVNFQTLGNLSNEALYLVATLPEDERTIGLQAFRNQFKSMEQTITNIEQADLKNWQESLKIAK